MSTPPNMDTFADGPLDDEDLMVLQLVRDMLDSVDPMPAELTERAKFAMSVALLHAEVASIVGIKEASGLVTRTQQILGRLGDRLVVLSGEDAINYPLYAVGARGCISVTSNVAPALISGAWDAVVAGDHARARALHAQSLPLTEALFLEASPTPAKTALGMMGRLEPELRLPLVAMSPSGREKLRTVLAQLSLV